MKKDKSNSKSIQIQVTNKEYEELQQRAEKISLTVPLYVKSQIFEDDGLTKYFEIAKTKLTEIKQLKPFSLKSLMKDEWLYIDKSQRLALGRAFLNYIKLERANDIQILDKDTAHTQMYMKMHQNNL